MPTRWTTTLIPTARQVPAEAEVPSHQLMLRAGLIRKLTAGVYDYLPLGWRALQKAMQIVREEMDAAGAVEVFLPTLAPIELFQQTGRDVAYGDNLFKLKDRHGRVQALGPTHEEVMTEMVGGYVESYKQLPLTLYQIQTKFRDEFRPRFGVLRSREFTMKDAYSFHLNLEGPGGLNEIYDRLYAAYCRIWERCGLPYVAVEAESGPIGGSASHEFMVITPTGEDTILESDQGNYAANVEKCETGPRPVGPAFLTYIAPGLPGVGSAHAGDAPPAATPSVPPKPPTGPLDKVHTPNCPAIDDVCKFIKVKPKNMLKTLIYEPTDEAARQATPFVVAVVRGDHEVNEGKLKALVGQPVQMADLQRAKAAGFAVGFVGPHAVVAPGAPGSPGAAKLYIDPDATADQFWAAGANEMDYHVKHFNWQRELLEPLGAAAQERVMVADIRNAVDGDPSPKGDGGVLKARKGIEIGHVFKLGTKYSKAMNVVVQNQAGERVPMVMGCYGIGVNRILACAIERQEPQKGYDENGVIFPASIAPYQVVITPIKYDGQAKEVADKLAAELEAVAAPVGPRNRMIDVLIDDRDERPGVKFKDADLIGIPVRITIGDKSLAEGKVEIKARNGSNGPKGELIAIGEAVGHVGRMLSGM